MTDALVLAALLASWTAIGYPIARLLPRGGFGCRWLAAPSFGLAAQGVAVTILYRYGMPLPTAVVLLSGLGVAATALLLARERAALRFGRDDLRLGATLGVVSILCLLPIWTGGPAFEVFQGNIYDLFNAYYSASVAHRHFGYDELKAAYETGVGDNPLLRSAGYALVLRPTAALLHAGFAPLGGPATPASGYAFMAALQVNMLPAAAFVFIHVFGMSRTRALLLGAALALGFFEQYVLDIDAVSQLAAQPLFLLLAGLVALAFDPGRWGGPTRSRVLRASGPVLCLAAGLLYLYPEGLAVYGPASTTAVGLALLRPVRGGAAGLTTIGLIAAGLAALLLCVPFWQGTADFLLRQMTGNALQDVDWWNYYHRHLLGRETNYLRILIDGDPQVSQTIGAWFSLPIESAFAAFGLHALLPTAAWPVWLGTIWKLALYALLGLIVAGSFKAIRACWRAGPGPARLLLAASVVACLVPFAILAGGQYWSAGKGLSMAAPLLFLLLTAPLAAPAMRPRWRVGAAVVVAGHLGLGLLRPVWSAEDSGSLSAGFPDSQQQQLNQKVGIRWDQSWLLDQLEGCRQLRLDLPDYPAAKYLELIVTDLGLAWSIPYPLRHKGFEPQPYEPPGSENFDCLVTSGIGVAAPGVRLIPLGEDGTVAEYLAGERDSLELAVERHPGISIGGAFELESTPMGALRWTGGRASFEIANPATAPAASLSLAAWQIRAPGEAQVVVRVNGKPVYSGPPPLDPVVVALAEFVGEPVLEIAIETLPTARYPHDTRDLGLPLRLLRVSR